MSDPVTYADVNAAWSPVLPLPPITGKETARIFRKVLRGFSWPRGERLPLWARRAVRTWAAPRGTDGPLGPGLPRMIHDASHLVFKKLHPTFRLHSVAHAKLELKMIQHVLAKGWHVPKPKKPSPTTDERRATRLASLQGRRKRWLSKQKRATTALRKLDRAIRRLAV
jgi:hypothetical protein